MLVGRYIDIILSLKSAGRIDEMLDPAASDGISDRSKSFACKMFAVKSI